MQLRDQFTRFDIILDRPGAGTDPWGSTWIKNHSRPGWWYEEETGVLAWEVVEEQEGENAASVWTTASSSTPGLPFPPEESTSRVA